MLLFVASRPAYGRESPLRLPQERRNAYILCRTAASPPLHRRATADNSGGTRPYLIMKITDTASRVGPK